MSNADQDPATNVDHDPLGTVRYENPTSSSGRFRVTGPTNKGGMGQVSAAQDEELHREVALKEIRHEYADNIDCRARFIQEAEITGGLEHPGIVPVYSLGFQVDGRPFYAMRFIRGSSLQQGIDRFHADYERGTASEHRGDDPLNPPNQTAETGKFESFEFRKLLRRFIDVCNAIEYAHSRGVVHRDLKPNNIMLGKYGETLVVDWGLAKVTGREDLVCDKEEATLRISSSTVSTATRIGEAHGTPSYMPPEQAFGILHQIGPASDVYSLGATLYCIITGRAPFSGKPDEIVARVKAGDFPHPRQVSPQVPKALEAICLRAMAYEVADRYPSAEALAEDVERYLAAGPAAARVERLINPPQHGLMGWAYRNPLMATFFLSLFPNFVLSVANVWYDGHVVLSKADVQAARIFWGMLVFWKVIFYGCGTAFALWQVMPMFNAMHGQPSPAELAAARRQCLRLGELIFWVSVVAWSAAGLVFPGWISFMLQFFGKDDPGGLPYGHFLAAHVLCGLVSGAIVMSALSFAAIRLFYPRLLKLSGSLDVKGDGLLEQSRRIDRFNSLAAFVPIMALIYMSFVDSDYKLAIMVMVLLGLLLMYVLAVKAIPEVKADLEALARSPTAFRFDQR